MNGGCHVKNLSKYLLNSTLAIVDSGGTGTESGRDDVDRHLNRGEAPEHGDSQKSANVLR